MNIFKTKMSFMQLSAIFALLIISIAGISCGGKPEMPTEAASQALVKSTVSDLADALNTGNFKVIRAKASEDFQMGVSEEKLIDTFKTYASSKETTVPLLRKAVGKDAKFSPAPSIREEKGNYVLVTDGNFDIAEPEGVFEEVKFNNEYVWRSGEWKLLKISVEIK